MNRCPRCGYLAELDPDPLDVQPADRPEPPTENHVSCLPALLVVASGLVVGLVLSVVLVAVSRGW